MKLVLLNAIDRSVFTNRPLYPEGGRACFFYAHYLVIFQAARVHPLWMHHFLFAATMKNHLVKWYFSPEQSVESYCDRFTSNPKLLRELENYLTETREAGVKVLSEKKPERLSSKELEAVFSSYFEKYWELMVTAGFLRMVDRGLMSRFREYFGDTGDVDGKIAVAAIPVKMSTALSEEIALLRLAARVESGTLALESKETEKELKKIEVSYAWGVMGYFDEKPKSLADYRHALVEYIAEGPEKKLSEIERKLAEDTASRETFTASLDEKGKRLLEVASWVPYLKDHYKFSINKLEYYAEPLFDELSRRSGYPVLRIKDFHPQEILDLLAGNRPDESLVEERVKRSVLVMGPGKTAVLVGKEAEEFEKTYLAEDASQDKEFKGRVACRGTAKGTVRVVLGTADFGKLKDGEILVVTNTSPDFVPILKRAGAIVAEDGGLTAHVSVVSREFGIPCIVGIRNITEILKDGDEVEVNANEGIVWIIKRAT